MAVIYLPVNTAEMRQFAADWNAGRQAKGKAPYTVIKCKGRGVIKNVRRVGFGALRNVNAGRKLYILSHGIHRENEQGAIRIGARRTVGGPLRMYTAPELAAHLESEGLTHQIRDVRLFSCQAGIGVNGGPSYGELFFDAMRARGYNLVEVSAYLGNLRSGYSRRQVPVGNEDDDHPYAVAEGNAYFTDTSHKGVDIVDEWGGTTTYPARSGRVRYI